MIFKKTLNLLLLICIPLMVLRSQVVYTDPALPTADAAVTIFFNSGGTGLEGYTGIVYAHTGLTIGATKWQHVIGTWGNNSVQPQLENIGNGQYKLVITPAIREFYSATLAENITEICLVFRSDDGSQQTSPDIFINVFEIGLNISLINPSQTPYFVDPGESIQIEAEATLADSVYLYLDGALYLAVQGNIITGAITASSDVDTKHWIKVVATDGVSSVADSNYYYVRGVTFVESLPAGLADGINYAGSASVTLALHAPYKSSVYVIGDFNNWEVAPEYKMKRTEQNPDDIDNRYWVEIEGLEEGEEYAFQYLVDEELRVADPYTDKILDKWNDGFITGATYPNLKPYPEFKTEGLVSVLQTGQNEYNWQITSFTPPAPEKLIIYELLLRDFLYAHDFKTLKDTLQYFKRLGITAIELMPVNEFEGNLSWGYNPSFYFAPDKYYGPKDDMKAFIDECHANGMAVIMDMVLNHAFGQNVMAQMYWDAQNNRPAANNPWFNVICPHEPYCWGNDFDHTSTATQAFVDRVNTYWMEEYKIDGFRFDFTQGFTNSGSGGSYNAERIGIIKRMADAIWDFNPGAYVILEHWCDNTEEKVLADYGCMLWGNHNYNYNEGTMGYNEQGKSDFSWISYKKRTWNDPHVVGFMESHDEERLMAKNINFGNASGNYNVKDTTIALQRQELAAVFFIPVPGPKMIWQFGELGYDYHINYPGLIGEDDHRLDPKPLKWNYTQDYRRKVLFNIYAALNKLKQEEPVFGTDNFSLNAGSSLKSIHLNHSSMNVTIIGNFGVVSGSINPEFQHAGMWYDYFTGDSLNVSVVSDNIMLQAGEYRIYTDVQLETPQTGLAIEGNSRSNPGIDLVYPNPSSGTVNIIFTITETAFTELNVYSMSGLKVKTILAKQLSPGEYTVKWNGTGDQDSFLTGGIYLIELNAGKGKEVVKVNMVKD
ncbi:MAG: T9SS type A sorting domain-containing protein [Bacteroidales bacterium]|nr:T9SS type A sorting domain-containing protein [Bacteroidales bacterium]